jgi:hypothetical protein
MWWNKTERQELPEGQRDGETKWQRNREEGRKKKEGNRRWR